MTTTTPLILLFLMVLSSLSICNQVLHESQVTSTVSLHTHTEPTHYQYHSKGARFARTVPSPPPKPVLFIVNITSVNITWNYPPTQPPTQFIVQSYSTAAPYHNISQMLNSTYYLYNGMAMGSFYIFRVIAYQSGVASTPSDETDVFVNGANAPTGPPSNFQAHIISSTSVELTWNSPKPDIDRVYTYHIFKGDNPTNLVQVDSISNENSYIFTNLLPQHTYYFTIQADISAIKSIMTPVLNVTTPSSRLYPLNIVNITVNVTMATVTWTPPPKHITVLQYYTVYYAVDALIDHASINNISLYQNITFDLNSQMGVVQNLEEGVVYVFRVQYTANRQKSELSDPVRAQTLSSIKCTLCESISSTQIWLKWMINNPKGKLYHYVILSSSCVNGTIVSSSNSTVSYNATELSPWTRCQYSIFINTIYGYLSQPSLCPSCTTLEARPSGVPRNFTGNALSSSSIILTWDLVPIKEQNGPILSYIIFCVGCPYRINTYTNSPAILTGLSPYSTYQFTVAAQNKADVGPETKPISIKTLEDKPAGPPLNISLINVTMTSFTMRWSPPQQTNGIILFYTVIYSCKEERTISLNTTNTIITLSNLQPNTQYTVQIMAWTSTGSGPLSERQSFKTVYSTSIDTTPPKISLTTEVIDKSLLYCFKVLISWNLTAQDDNSANYTLTYYASTINSTDITLNKLNYIILSFGQLKSNTNYTFQLDVDLPYYNDSLTQVKSLNTPSCTGVITLVVVVSVLVSAFLLVLCGLCISCLCLCYYHRYKRHHRQTTSYAMDIMHQPLSMPNEYITVMRENRGDGQSSVSDSNHSSEYYYPDSVFNRIVPESDSTDSDFGDDERLPLMEATPPIIRPTPVLLPPPYNFNSFVISSEGYIINEPVHREDEGCYEDKKSDYSDRLIPIGSSTESSHSSISNELYFN